MNDTKKDQADDRWGRLITEYDEVQAALPTEERDEHGQPIGPVRDQIIQLFTSVYGNTLQTWANTFWMGHQVAKCPLDLWVYQEIMWEKAPTMILETGSCIGGSALFFAHMFDLMDTYQPNVEARKRSVGKVGSGKIVSIDKDPYPDSQPVHPRIQFLVGDSVSQKIIDEATLAVRGQSRVMVVLDSLHTYEHVNAELTAYGRLVTPGSYLVVEDTGMPGARQAALEFVTASNGEFIIDKTREKHMMTSNPDGWIYRKT